MKNSFLIRLSLIIITCCSVTLLTAQQPFFYKVDSDMGLPSDEVYEVEQDSFGYIWIGCDAGLFRYDGVEFKAYRHNLQSGRSISSLKIDANQRVWCQNFSGQIFYALGDSLHLFNNFSNSARSFPMFELDRKNNHIWVATDTMINCFDAISNQKLYSTNKFSETFYSQSTALSIHQGEVYTMGNRIEKINTITKKQERIDVSAFYLRYSHAFYKIDDDLIVYFYEDSRKKYQFVRMGRDCIELINTVAGELSNHFIYKIIKLGNYYALATSDGVKLTNKRFEIIKSFLPNEKISDILEDREGNIWLTSLQNGIYIIPSLELEFFSDDFFPESNITALTVHNKQLVIGTYSGNLFYFNPAQNTFESQPARKIGEYGAIKTFGYYKNKWLVSRPTMVSIDKNKNEESFIRPSNIRQMVEMQDTLFFVSANMIGKFTYRPSIDIIQPKAGRAITKHPSQDVIYYGSINGFFEYENGQSRELFHENQKLYPSDFAWQGDTLWISTATNGLFLFVNDKCIQHIQHGKSLPGTTLRKLYRYQNKMLIATNVGIVSMDLDTKESIVFNASDGLRQKEINAMEVIDGVLYVGTPQGLIRFPLSMDTQNDEIPNIAITEVKVNNEAFFYKKNPYLPYNRNNLTIAFKTALMRSRGDFYYEYRLIGLDDTWKKTNAINSEVDYNTLPSGKFRFEVRSANEDGVRSKIASIDFIILAPVWERWWFILLAFLLVSGLIYWLMQRRIRNIQHQANVQNELKSSQLTAIKAQMNPHFLYNALNSIQDLILQKDIRNASRYLSKFSLLMRQVLEVSSDMSVSMMRELEILQLYLDLEKLRFGDEFEYQLNLPKGQSLEAIQIPSMIIQPFVENAIKHGLLHKTNGQKQLSIDFQIKDIVICTITDNGVGRAHSAKIKARRGLQPVSFATSATQRRLDILNQTHSEKIGFEIIDLYEKENAIGTKVILTIPIWSED